MNQRILNGGFWLLLGLFVAAVVVSLVKGVLLFTGPVKPDLSSSPPAARSSAESARAGPVETPDLPPARTLKMVQKQNSGDRDNEASPGEPLRSLSGDSIQEIRETRLPFELVGTTSGPGSHRFALVRHLESKRVRQLEAGQAWDSLRLETIKEEWVRIHNRKRGSTERLMLRRSHPPALFGPAGKREAKSVSRYQINRAIHSNMNNLLASVDARPVLRDGDVAGFQIRNLRGRPGQLLNELGFREGDVIRRVNGRKINGVDRAMQLWAQLRNKKQFRIEILRDGEVQTLAYSLVR